MNRAPLAPDDDMIHQLDLEDIRSASAIRRVVLGGQVDPKVDFSEILTCENLPISVKAKKETPMNGISSDKLPGSQPRRRSPLHATFSLSTRRFPLHAGIFADSPIGSSMKSIRSEAI